MRTAITNARWKNAIANRGRRAIWFDPEADNHPRSLECIELNNVSAKVEKHKSTLPQLELQCYIEPLLQLLPKEYQDAIRAIDKYPAKLVDICIDVGRIPYVFIGKRQREVLMQDGSTVSKETIDEILRKLGGEMRIGNDNRAGIDRQLHRISVMRSKTDEIYGLTMRVGRALRNAACALTDLLLSERHSSKSVLVLGHPGSGKTTLIRDVARCVSETMENVCIIDTSNEIGGDGLVPHACVGWARRMMVRSLEEQASVMIECVQNHTVETLIIDEIGRKAEVLAASTVRQRGPRLIASAHGDFRALIKNPDLKGLVGGSQQVLVGDAAAAKSTNKNKLQTQRAGNPIFDVIVELDHVMRGQCRIIWDVAKAVDCVLGGQNYSFETRQWDSTTRSG
ncbi:BTB and MATH domain-containing protein 41 [Phytophthora boehmeriae]|uniref:BTB and MATH domain-containing protein 41 n=1 Tax=Phytophthora boehmeriae TaxID=109152 RepID=A0A8T1WYH0_9STRA|nr:BTB and MATH domain-containing protein 41 [Phytophthora boehmeriae]